MAVVLISLLAPGIISKTIGAAAGVEMGGGVPSTAWVAMGTDMDNWWRAPGWYNGYNQDVYVQNGYDSAAASAQAIEKIKENVRESAAEPKKSIVFYAKKVLSMWSEPLFQSVWSGPGLDGGASATKRVLQSLYSGGKLEKLCNLFAKCMLVTIYAATLHFRIRQKEKGGKTQLLYLYFIGGFVFHLFWEAKSQYVYTYVFLLLPICAYELCELQNWLQSKLKR